MCSPLIPVFLGLGLVPVLTTSILKDWGRLKTKLENAKAKRDADNADKPLVGGSGAALLTHPARALQAEATRLGKLVNYDTQRPAVIWFRLQEIRQAVHLKQAYGNEAVWPGNEPTQQIPATTVLHRVGTALAVVTSKAQTLRRTK